MQENTQPDQNPVDPQINEVQEEKSETATAVNKDAQTDSTPTSEVKPQITDSENLEVRIMLQGKQAEKPLILEAPVEEMNDVKQITETDRLEIVSSLKGVEDAKEKVLETASQDLDEANDGKQITEADRLEIISLLKGVEAVKGKVKETTSEAVEDDAMSFDSIDLDHLNKQELIELLEDVVLEQDLSKIRSHISKLKGAYLPLLKEDRERQLSDFVAGGGEEKNFEYHSDPLDDRYNQAFRKYKDIKARFTQDMEKQKQTNLTEKHRILSELK